MLILYDVSLDPDTEDLLKRLAYETNRPPHELASVLLSLVLHDMSGEGVIALK